MVVEIQNPGVGMEEDCLNLTSACAILMSLLRMVFYILIHQTAACLHQLVLTAKARCRYNTGSLIKHHRFKSLCSTVKVRVNAPFWDISTLRRPVSSGSLSSISRHWMRAESDPLVKGDFQWCFGTKLPPQAGTPSGLEQKSQVRVHRKVKY